MNGKFDEKLAQLAFGDLSPDESARIETATETDSEAASSLVQYRQMKQDLALLRDIPEDQLSTERLRHAILAQGLKPARKGSASWGWIWMPAAACALAFGLMMFRPRPTVDPRLVLDDSAAKKALRGFAKLDLRPVPSNAAVPSVHRPLMVASRDDNRTRSWDSFDRFAHRRLATRHSRKRNDPNADLAWAEALFDPRGWDGQPSAGAPQKAPVIAVPTRVASNDAPSPSSDAPLVLIDQDKDSSTGANTATEVGSASNVLVGG